MHPGLGRRVPDRERIAQLHVKRLCRSCFARGSVATPKSGPAQIPRNIPTMIPRRIFIGTFVTWVCGAQLLECASMRARVTIVLLLWTLGASSAEADTIHLKNGRSILADSVRENGNHYEYDIGDDSYAIPSPR